MFKRHFTTWISLGLLFAIPTFGRADDAPDPYQRYVENAPEFKPVKQDPAFLLGRWDTWIYMPWRFQWTIGTDAAGGEFCRDLGINGGFTTARTRRSAGSTVINFAFITITPRAKATYILQEPKTKGISKSFSATRARSDAA